MIERPLVLESTDSIQLHPNKLYDLIFYKSDIRMNRAILIPLVIYFVSTTFTEFDLVSVFLLVLQFLIGLFFWTLTEYNAHRYNLHGNEDLPESKNVLIRPQCARSKESLLETLMPSCFYQSGV